MLSLCQLACISKKERYSIYRKSNLFPPSVKSWHYKTYSNRTIQMLSNVYCSFQNVTTFFDFLVSYFKCDIQESSDETCVHSSCLHCIESMGHCAVLLFP